MRIIPKDSKVKLTIYKGITPADLILGFTALGLVCLAVVSNISFKYILACGIVIAFVPAFITSNGQRGYMMCIYLFMHMARQKHYADGGKYDTENLIPYLVVHDDGIVENKDSSFIGFLEVRPVDLRIMSEDKQDAIFGVFERALTHSAAEAAIIKIERPLVLDNYIDYEIERIGNLAQMLDDGALTEQEYLSRVDVAQSRLEDIDSMNSGSVSNSRYYLSIQSGVMSELQAVLQRTQTMLQSGGIPCKILDKRETATMLRFAIDDDFDERNGVNRITAPKELHFGLTSARQNNKTLSHFVITDYPLHVPSGWGEGLFDMPCTKVVMRMKPVDNYKAVKRIDNALLELSTQGSRHKASELNAQELHAASLQELLLRLQSQNETLYDTTLIITAYDEPKKNTVKKAVRRRLKEMGFSFSEAFARQETVWRACQLGKDAFLKTSRGIPSSSLAACFPFVSDAVTDDKGLLIGENKLPVFVDFFKRDGEHLNSNLVVIGKSGSGKSYAVKSVIAQLASDSNRVYILDPENEYTSLTGNMGGKVLDAADSKYGKINPFHIIASEIDENDVGSGNDFFAHLQFLEEFYRVVLPGISADCLELLNKTTQELYEWFQIDSRTDIRKLSAADFPLFDNLAALIDERTEAERDEYNRSQYKVLSHYIAKFKDGGRFSNLWNGPTTFAPDENFITFSFQKLFSGKNRTVADAQMLLIMKWLENEVIRNRDFNMAHGTKRRIVVVIDEAHLFIDAHFPIALDFMYTLAKRIRKYDGMLIVITQNLKDFTGSPETARKSAAIINAAQYSLIFNLSPDDMADLCALYEHAGRINEAECEHIVHNERGTAFFISSPSHRTNIRIVANEHIKGLF